MEAACAKCESLAAQLQADKERRAKLNSQLLTLRESSRTWASERLELEQALASRDSELESLQAQLAEKAAEVTSLSTELSHATFARECAAGDVSELQAQVQELGGELQEQQSRAQQAQAQVTTLNDDCTSLRSQLAAECTAREEAEAAAHVAITEGGRLAEEVLRLQVQVHELQADIAGAEQACSRLQQQLDEQTAAHDAAKLSGGQSVHDLQGQVRRAEGALAAMETAHRAAMETVQMQLELALAEKAEAESYHHALEQQLKACQAAQHVAQDRVRQISHDALAAQLNRVPSPPALQKQARSLSREAAASSVPALGSPLAADSKRVGEGQSQSEDRETHVALVDAYRRDLDTAKAFGKALLQSNRQLQEEVRLLKLQLAL